MTPAVHSAPQFTTEEAAALAHELYQLEAAAEPLPGERDQNFLLRNAAGARYVLKISNPNEDRQILEMQNQALTFLAGNDTGLDWPKLVPDWSGESISGHRGHMVRLLTWVDGTCLALAEKHGPQLLASLGRALAKVDNALEGFTHEAARRDLYWDLRRAPLARRYLKLLSGPQRAIVEPLLDACITVKFDELRQGVIYNDANDYNVLVSEDGARVVALLDLGDMVHSATVCDLAIALAYVMLDKPDPIAAAAQVVAAYHAVRPLDGSRDGVAVSARGRPPGDERVLCGMADRPSAGESVPEHFQPARLGAAGAAGAISRGMAAQRCSAALARASRHDLLADRRKHLGPSLSISYDQPLHIIRGWRQYLYDSGGRGYLDCVNNVAHVGHCHPRVTEAIARQMALLNTNTRYLHEYLTEYLERLTATLPEPLRVVYLVCSGSEANELALRLARAHTGRRGVVVVETAYHGNTNALVEISPYKFNGPGGRGKPAHVQVVPMPDVYRGPYRGADAGSQYARNVADAMRTGGVAAFFCESALGCGGQVVPAAGIPARVVRCRSRGGRSVRRRRSADGLRPRGFALLDVRAAGRSAGYRHHGQADRQRPSDGRGGDHARNCALVRQRHGVLQHLRRQPGVVRSRTGGARRNPR